MLEYRAEGLCRNANHLNREELSRCMASGEVLQSTALAYDTGHRLRFELGGLRGIMPFADCVDAAPGETVKDIAVLTRVGRPTCFVIMGTEFDDNGEEYYLLSRAEAQRRCRAQYLDTLEAGSVIPCTVTHIENFGAFCDMEMLNGIVSDVPERAKKLAAAFWPGPLTMVMPRGPEVSDVTCAGLDTVGVRMPSHPVVQQVIKASGVAFAAPSANLSGKPSPTNAPDTLADMDGRLPLILDGGESNVGVESTVVAVTGEHPMLLRPGYVTKEQMEAVLGEEVLVSPAILEKLKDGEVARSPGMKYKHYAPKAQVTILRGDFAKYKEFIKQHTEPGVWALCFDGEGAQLGVPFIEYGKNHDGVTQAHHLFTALRDLDKHGAQVVYARCPEQDGVSMAVYNRLIRAAAFRVVEL